MNLMSFIWLMIQTSWDSASICKQPPDWEKNDNDDENAITWMKAYEIVINSISISVRARIRFSSQFRTFVAYSIVKQFVRFSWLTIIIKSVILLSCSFSSYLQLLSLAWHIDAPPSEIERSKRACVQWILYRFASMWTRTFAVTLYSTKTIEAFTIWKSERSKRNRKNRS